MSRVFCVEIEIKNNKIQFSKKKDSNKHYKFYFLTPPPFFYVTTITWDLR